MRAPNQAQNEAINQTEGPVLIIAGPGSGKTFTLIERIIKLIQEKDVTPESMLVVTFTEKAARELETRISNRLGELKINFDLHEMYVGTFHGICLRFLEEFREHTRLKRNFIVLEPFDQQYLIFQKWWNFYKSIQNIDSLITEKAVWKKSQQIANYVNKVTEEAITINSLLSHDDPRMHALASCCQLYQEHLIEQNSLDFSRIQSEFYELLISNKDIENALKNKLKYIMVDEYQDTNAIQELILNKLRNKDNNLCVVGDDDQGLYRFRGATIRNIFEFPKKFPKSSPKQVKLSTNYRSHPSIINFYNGWIDDHDWSAPRGKVFRYPKEMLPCEAEFPSVPAVISVDADDLEEWPAEIHKFLLNLKKNGLEDWNQIAFLFRSVNNPNVRNLSNYLESVGIPVYSPRSNMYFDRPEVKLMIGAYLSIFPNYKGIRQGSSSYENPIWTYYDFECEQLFRDELKKSQNKELAKFIAKLSDKHETLSGNTDYAFIRLFYQLISHSLFANFLSEESMRGPDKGRAQRNLSKFSTFLSKFEYLHNVNNVFIPKYFDSNIKKFFNDYLPYLKEGGIDEYEDEEEYAPSGCVSFLTIHQSKGLEYPVVIVGSLWDKPNDRPDEVKEYIDEHVLEGGAFEPRQRITGFDFKRLYYTAFSRAQNLLVLSWGTRLGGSWPIPGKEFAKHTTNLPRWDSSTINYQKFKFEKVKEINLKRQYSFTSDILLYEKCPEQYRLFKELEFSPVRISPMLFGTLVHQTIEDIHKSILAGGESEIGVKNITNWFEENYELLSKSSRISLAPSTKKAALDQVLNYAEREKKNWNLVSEAELEISLVKPNYVLVGSVDLIKGKGDTVEIVDFKSEAVPEGSIGGNAEQYKRQLEIYAHLVEEKIGKKVSKMHLYYTGSKDQKPYVTFERNSENIGKTVAAFDSVVQKIESKDYTMASRPVRICGDCDFKGYCNSKFEKKV
ncbi:ATP-dependent helicase [Polynucleobacter paneuropaeus]|nr:ATP-dependent helicase [Polynucleobacter paneuropaeus]